MEQQSPQQEEDTVLVPPTIAVDLHARLEEQGRSFGTPADVAAKLDRILAQDWGTPKARRFQEKDAPGGWLIDVSDYLEGEMLYLMIRTVHGRRALTAVVDQDEYEAFLETKTWNSEEAKNVLGVDPEVAAAAASIEAGEPRQIPGRAGAPAPPRGQAPVTVAPQTSPEDLCLMVIVSGQGNAHTPQIVRCTRAEVPDKVAELLQQSDVTEDNIEIWTCVSKPKVQVTF